ENWKQNNQSRCRKKYQIRTEHARDCARGAYRRQRRIRICHHLREAGDAPADQIKNRKSYRAHSVFDVVAKNPERPHVGNEVEPPAMQELVRENRRVSNGRKTDISSPIWTGEARRHNCEKIK